MASNQEMQQHNDTNEVQPQRLVDRLTRMKTIAVLLALCVFGLVFILVTYLVPMFNNAPISLPTRIIQQIGLALFITSIVAITVAILVENTRNRLEKQLNDFLKNIVTKRLDDIQKDTENQIGQLKGEITGNIEGQTRRLVETSTSLQAMGTFNVSQLYVKREDAVENIRQDLLDKNISKIRLIGISLNDFVRDTGVFHEIWKIIANYAQGVRKPSTSGGQLDIRILIADPNCFGAHLRSRGELRHSVVPLQSRLAKDIDFTSDALSELEQTVNQKGAESPISFSFHLYQLPPILFLLWTDKASYIQQYYFWSSRDPAIHMPLLRYSGESSLHKSMVDHFDWIWDEASIASSDYYDRCCHGADKGLHQSGVINVFDDPDETKKRIISLMEGTKNRLYIQGFLLRSYFDGESDLYWTIRRLAEKGSIDIKILLINPHSQQAKYRSFREYLLEKPEAEISFEQFEKESYNNGIPLYRDAERSVKWLRRIASSCPVKTGVKNSSDPKGSFGFKWYDTAPYCFMLMVDDSVLIEQYHYGKVGPSVGSTILGKDMVRFEYAREPSDSTTLYDSNKRLPTYELLESHFNFVFDKCAQEVPADFAS